MITGRVQNLGIDLELQFKTKVSGMTSFCLPSFKKCARTVQLFGQSAARNTISSPSRISILMVSSHSDNAASWMNPSSTRKLRVRTYGHETTLGFTENVPVSKSRGRSHSNSNFFSGIAAHCELSSVMKIEIGFDNETSDVLECSGCVCIPAVHRGARDRSGEIPCQMLIGAAVSDDD
jgi:hypothetical protein